VLDIRIVHRGKHRDWRRGPAVPSPPAPAPIVVFLPETRSFRCL